MTTNAATHAANHMSFCSGCHVCAADVKTTASAVKYFSAFIVWTTRAVLLVKTCQMHCTNRNQNGNAIMAGFKLMAFHEPDPHWSP